MSDAENCPSGGIYHETHRYCPDCDWREEPEPDWVEEHGWTTIRDWMNNKTINAPQLVRELESALRWHGWTPGRS